MMCPCGSNKISQDCCDLYISGKMIAPTAETLMRSRYSAYHLSNLDYIKDTMLPPAATGFDLKQAKKKAKQTQWTGLHVLKTWYDLLHPDRAYVEFIAHYKFNNNSFSLHEISEFHFINGKW